MSLTYYIFLAFKEKKNSLWWQKYDSPNLEVQSLSFNKGKPVVAHVS